MSFKFNRQSLPPALRQMVSDYRWRQNHIGMTSAKVFHLTAQNKNSLYLKINPQNSGCSLLQEKLRLDWLENRLPVPEALLFAEDENNEYLLLSEIPGLAAIEDSLKNDVPQIIGELVNGLKMIHELPKENCPFSTRLEYKIEAARERMSKGLVEQEDFDDERQGRDGADIFREVLATKPPDEDLVFTHGDYCVPNVIIENGKLSGFVDLAEAGVADRYQDLALLTRSVCRNFGKEFEESVFELYGVEPDWRKINFFRLLDEFF